MSDVPGVLIDGIPQSTLGTAELESLIAGGIATAGMAAKLRAAAAALTAGAPSVRIGDLDVLRDPAAGTRILAATPQPA